MKKIVEEMSPTTSTYAMQVYKDEKEEDMKAQQLVASCIADGGSGKGHKHHSTTSGRFYLRDHWMDGSC